MRAGALRRVEREGVRGRVLERNARRRAHQVPRIEALLPGPVVVDRHRPLALAHRLLQRGDKTLARLLPHDQPVDNQVDRVDLVAVEAHPRRDLADLAVDPCVDIPLPRQRLEQLPVVALATLHHRGHQRDAPPGKAFENQLRDPVVRVVDHLLARHRRVGPRRPRVEQAQEVVDLRHGPHRRTRVLVRGLLLNGDNRAQSRDLVHVGTLHRPHELTRIGRQRLHVAALSLGVDRVEGQRRLPRPRKTRDDHQFAARNFQIHVFQVVDPSALYLDRFLHIPEFMLASRPKPVRTR